MSEPLRRLAHDLRGPALTVQGFAAELRLAVAELSRLAAENGESDVDADDGAELARAVAAIVETDLEPCLECIASAATTLAERIDGLDGAAAQETRAA